MEVKEARKEKEARKGRKEETKRTKGHEGTNVTFKGWMDKRVGDGYTVGRKQGSKGWQKGKRVGTSTFPPPLPPFPPPPLPLPLPFPLSCIMADWLEEDSTKYSVSRNSPVQHMQSLGVFQYKICSH